MITLALAATLVVAPPTVTRIQSFDSLRTIAVAGAPTGSLFAASQESGNIRVMNAATRLPVYNLIGHPQPAYGLAFSPNGQWLVTGDETSRIYVWNMKTGAKVREFPRGTKYHQRGIQSLSFTPDGKTLVSTGKDDVVISWDFASMTPKSKIGGNGVVFANATPIKSGMVIATLVGGLQFRTAKGVVSKKDPHTSMGLNGLAFNASRTKMVSAGRDNGLAVWDTTAQKRLALLKGHDDWVQYVAISPNGKLGASSANDRNVVIWDLVGYKKISTLADQCAVGAPLAFTGDGRYLISVNINDGLQINSVSPGQPAGK
ncbi:MAG: hypothetical protein JNK63_06010 [Chthonomonas sp.]|nr:hypothetical protein [Chthonomonas sp.]